MRIFQTIALFCIALFCSSANAQEGCCEVVSVDVETGTVTGRITASGETYEFTVGNEWLLQKLEPGISYGDDYIEGVGVPPDALEPGWGDSWSEVVAQVGDDTFYAEEMPAEIPAVQLSDGLTLHNIVLKRRGSRALKLTFDVTNETNKQVGLLKYSMVNNGQLSRITLVDFDAGKRYEVVTDDTGNCVCSRGTHPALWVDAGTTKSFWAHFAAPPSHVTMLTLDIPAGVPVDDIPIQ